MSSEKRECACPNAWVSNGGGHMCERPRDFFGAMFGALDRVAETTPVPSEVAETTAGEREVEALAKVLPDCEPQQNPDAPAYYRAFARAVLASDWLAAHDDRVRREEGAKVLREAADALNREGLSFKEGGWGSNPADQQTSVMVKTLTWLRARAASVGRAPEAGA